MRTTAKRPFWLHQLAEYIIGLAAVASGFQSADPFTSSIMGALILVNAAVADGPFGAFRLMKRRHHRIADMVVLALMVVLVVLADGDVSTRLVQVGLALVFLVVVAGSDYREVAEKKRRNLASTSTSTEIGRRAGKVAGSWAVRWRDRARRARDEPD